MATRDKITGLRNKDQIVEELTKRYFKSITVACIEQAPKIENAFEIRKEVVKNIKELSNKE